MTFPDFCDHVRTGCLRYDGSVISWFRSVKRNHEVGGSADSFHLSGLACDVTFDEQAGAQAAFTFWKRAGLGVKFSGESGRTVHVQAFRKEGG